MSTEMTTTAPGAASAAEDDASRVQGHLHAWAASMGDAKWLADALCKSAFAPEHLRGNPVDAAVTIMKGAALGLDPIAAMEAVYVIGGRPALYARAMLAVVLRAGHDVWVEEASDEAVTVCGRRRDSQHVQSSTWTIERAKLAGYLRNKKYASEPQAMLRAKATAEVCRMVGADALMGVSYAAEEIELDGGVGEEPRVRVGRRRRRTEPEPEPEGAGAVDVGDAEVVVADE